MSISRIWLSVMEVMARSCEVVLLVDDASRVREIVTVLALSSDLVNGEAVGAQVGEIITSGDVSLCKRGPGR
jgi:hypothetical protein